MDGKDNPDIDDTILALFGRFKGRNSSGLPESFCSYFFLYFEEIKTFSIKFSMVTS